MPGLTHHCLPCLTRLAHFTIEMVTPDPKRRFELTRAVCQLLSDQMIRGKVPAHLGTEIQRLLTADIDRDVYASIKETDNQTAEKLVATLEPQKLSLAQLAQLSIIGNVIDSALFRSATELNMLHQMINEDYNGDFDAARLERNIDSARTILYLTDNCGEIIFDRILIERLQAMGKEITLSPRSQAICNDATSEDVIKYGLTKYTTSLVPGSASMGLNLDECSTAFMEKWHTSDLIIAKGMGNYEALGSLKNPIIYLFKAKCIPVAERADAGLNENLMFFSSGCLG